MWNERQRSQKIAIELERLRRELAEQDRSFADLVAESGVSRPEIDEAGRELARHEAASPKEHAPVTQAADAFALVGWVVRG